MAAGPTDNDSLPERDARVGSEDPSSSAFCCGFCRRRLHHTVIDLGAMPLANSFRRTTGQPVSEPRYPLKVFVCDGCYLVQAPEHVSPVSIFSDYPYLSSCSSTWVEHARLLAGDLVSRYALTARSTVVEVASNDGYLLQWFAAAGVPVLGIEPAVNIAPVARAKGVPTEVAFFGRRYAEELVARGVRADVLIANNVLAHVPDIHDFTAGMTVLLAEHGALSVEFPHVLKLVQDRLFDTIYHEHYFYLSLSFIERLFARHRLRLLDVDQLSTQGGSLRVTAAHENSAQATRSEKLQMVLNNERSAGLDRIDGYSGLEPAARGCRADFLQLLAKLRREAVSVAAYGAPAKGNTFLNYCGVSTDHIRFTVDRSPHKQGCLLPGSGIPVRPVEALEDDSPDCVIILPWNLRHEIEPQLREVLRPGPRYITAIPELRVT